MKNLCPAALLLVASLSACASHPLQREAAALNTRATEQLRAGTTRRGIAARRARIQPAARRGAQQPRSGGDGPPPPRRGARPPLARRRAQPRLRRAWNNLGVAHLQLAPASGVSDEIPLCASAFPKRAGDQPRAHRRAGEPGPRAPLGRGHPRRLIKRAGSFSSRTRSRSGRWRRCCGWKRRSWPMRSTRRRRARPRRFGARPTTRRRGWWRRG